MSENATPVRVIGLDVGTTCVKAVALSDDHKILGRAVIPTRGYFQDCADEALRHVLDDAGHDGNADPVICATGYAASSAPRATMTVGESTALAIGAYAHFPRKMSVLDLGGQSPRVVQVDENGRRVRTFRARKCAVGPGMFLACAAEQLGVHPSRLQDLAGAVEEPVPIGSYCSVFANMELMERLRDGASREAVALGCLESVADRVLEMGGIGDSLVAAGGLAEYYPAVLSAIESRAGCRVQTAPEPITVCALGAAHFALRRDDEQNGHREARQT